jgi:hypothetical protein
VKVKENGWSVCYFKENEKKGNQSNDFNER